MIMEQSKPDQIRSIGQAIGKMWITMESVLTEYLSRLVILSLIVDNLDADADIVHSCLSIT
jgi:hypothetical protein